MDIEKKKIVVAGLGKTGFDTAVFLANRKAEVYVTESNRTKKTIESAALLNRLGVKTEIGIHTEEFMTNASFLVASPGIPKEALPIKYAKDKDIDIISEVELAFLFSPTTKIIAITGTNGKTTTTSLTGEIFKQAGLPSIVCGNIGNPFIGEIDKIHKDTFVILEISSFQLQGIKKFRPLIASLLNIAEDHVDRHISMNNYIEAKKMIFTNQKKNDLSVLNYDDRYCRAISNEIKSEKFFFSQREDTAKGLFIKENRIFSNLQGEEEVLVNIEETKLWGKGNADNMMAAALIGLLSGIKKEVIKSALYRFSPLPHRLEKVATINGILFINDSKSTNPHSVINAIESIARQERAVLIMGGKNKKMSFTDLIPSVKSRIKSLILLGESADIIAETFKDSGIPLKIVRNMQDAVRTAFHNSLTGDIVILSPGCASFDMFNDYKERGDVFKKEVRSLF